MPAPDHLSDRARAWWTAVYDEYVVRPVDEPLLELACDALDRYLEARADVRANGSTQLGARGTVVARPAAVTMREAHREYANACKQLGLDRSEEP